MLFPEKKEYGSRKLYLGVMLRLLNVVIRFTTFENVPVGICRECGERIFKGKVLEELEELIKIQGAALKEIKIPVYSYQQ